jgi:hypothetical protein
MVAGGPSAWWWSWGCSVWRRRRPAPRRCPPRRCGRQCELGGGRTRRRLQRHGLSGPAGFGHADRDRGLPLLRPGADPGAGRRGPACRSLHEHRDVEILGRGDLRCRPARGGPVAGNGQCRVFRQRQLRPELVGADVVLTATVTPASGNGAPTGTVSFSLSDPAPTGGVPWAKPPPTCAGVGSTIVAMSGGSATCDVGPLLIIQSAVKVVASSSGDAGDLPVSGPPCARPSSQARAR